MLAWPPSSSIIPGMADDADIDLRAAVNAISDVVQNRPRPLRVFDQIYMKTGDMVLQSELVARWAKGKKLAFLGDGDAISVCVAYLHNREIINYGPSEITVFDFDERICGAVTRFADNERLDQIRAQLYNCLDAFPGPTDFDCFYTNPLWGASNDGESVRDEKSPSAAGRLHISKMWVLVCPVSRRCGT
jgi:predicted methyltransferase